MVQQDELENVIIVFIIFIYIYTCILTFKTNTNYLLVKKFYSIYKFYFTQKASQKVSLIQNTSRTTVLTESIILTFIMHLIKQKMKHLVEQDTQVNE